MLESQRAHACSLRHQASCLSNLVGQVVHEKLSYVNLAGWFPDRFPRKCFRGLVVQTLSVILDKRRAVAFQFDFKNITCEVKARREVIMSAGTTNTAQLLMLSGIGPKEHLEEFKIPVVADFPVGNNLQNHVAAILPYALDPKIPTIKQKLENLSNIQENFERRSGIIANPVAITLKI
ncbi:hypothetical protein AVEN_219201-1 [Araneus ventricosus]|uniref:Glucose-methanol-choline oxidoreductase N-terminal domain-containing protein n=1 Tax=Araneus ventricosus TaxID=182803 RepID=A0A4Y2HWG4_ARAVE|nr:hypothetical protein AVEN_219201-1 [Araneus ventricosus]